MRGRLRRSRRAEWVTPHFSRVGGVMDRRSALSNWQAVDAISLRSEFARSDESSQRKLWTLCRGPRRTHRCFSLATTSHARCSQDGFIRCRHGIRKCSGVPRKHSHCQSWRLASSIVSASHRDSSPYRLRRDGTGGRTAVRGWRSYFNDGIAGQPMTWVNGAVTSSAADAFVADAFSGWTGVSKAAVKATRGGQIAEDVRAQT